MNHERCICDECVGLSRQAFEADPELIHVSALNREHTRCGLVILTASMLIVRPSEFVHGTCPACAIARP